MQEKQLKIQDYVIFLPHGVYVTQLERYVFVTCELTFIAVMCDELKTPERQYRNQQTLYQPVGLSRQNMVKPTAQNVVRPTGQNIVRPTSLETDDNSGALTDTKHRASNTADLSGNALRPRNDKVIMLNVKSISVRVTSHCTGTVQRRKVRKRDKNVRRCDLRRQRKMEMERASATSQNLYLYSV